MDVRNLTTEIRLEKLFEAVKTCDKVTLRNMCQFYPEELKDGRDADGKTVLHCVNNARLAQLIVESGSWEDRQTFLFAVDDSRQTVLHKAANENRVGVVGYFCGIMALRNKLAQQTDSLSRTALHYAKSNRVAMMLVNSILPPHKRPKYLAAGDISDRTALHIAAHSGAADVVQYLCDFSVDSKPVIHRTQRTEEREAPRKRQKLSRYVQTISANLDHFAHDLKFALLVDNQGKSALHYAKNMNTACIISEMYMDHGVTFPVDKYKITPLHLAAYEGRADVVQYLSNLPSPYHSLPDQKDSYGRTPLHFARDSTIVELLVTSVPAEERERYVLATDDRKCTALHAAAHMGRKCVVEHLCRKYVHCNLPSAREQNGRAALHYAKTEEVAALLIKSVEPTKQREYVISNVDDQMCTALHVAAGEGNLEIVKYLCELLPDDELVIKTDLNKNSALHHARSGEIAQLLIDAVDSDKQRKYILAQNGDNECTALHSAVGRDEISTANLLCTGQSYADELLHAVDKDGQTPLHYVKSKEMVQLLVAAVPMLKRKEYIFHTDSDGCSVLHGAAFAGRTDVVKYLCKEKDLVLKTDNFGKTALHCALNKKIAQILVESIERDFQMEYISMVEQNGKTALQLAVERGNIKITEYFCKLCRPNYDLLLSRDKFGDTVLHSSSSKQMIKLLVESLEPDKQLSLLLAVNNDKQTALHVAALNGQIDIAEYLCEVTPLKEKLLIKKDGFGKTALHYLKWPQAKLLLDISKLL